MMHGLTSSGTQTPPNFAAIALIAANIVIGNSTAIEPLPPKDAAFAKYYDASTTDLGRSSFKP